MPSQQQYVYKPRIFGLFLSFVIYGFAAFFLAYLAQTNDRGLIIDGLITLSEDNATIFYHVCSFIGGIMLFLAVMDLATRIKYGDQYLEIRPDGFVLPKTVLHEERHIYFKDIKSAAEVHAKGVHALFLSTKTGRVQIHQNKFNSKKEFKEVSGFIRESVKAAKRLAVGT